MQNYIKTLLLLTKCNAKYADTKHETSHIILRNHFVYLTKLDRTDNCRGYTDRTPTLVSSRWACGPLRSLVVFSRSLVVPNGVYSHPIVGLITTEHYELKKLVHRHVCFLIATLGGTKSMYLLSGNSLRREMTTKTARTIFWINPTSINAVKLFRHRSFFQSITTVVRYPETSVLSNLFGVDNTTFS